MFGALKSDFLLGLSFKNMVLDPVSNNCVVLEFD